MLQESNLNVALTDFVLLDLEVLLEFVYDLLVLFNLVLEVLDYRLVLALFEFGEFLEVIDIL